MLLAPLPESPPLDPGRLRIAPLQGDPPEQMRTLLEAAKRSRAPFDLAWETSMEHIVWPVSAREARSWRDMLNATREGWRATYENFPQLAQEKALTGLAEVFARLTAA